MSRQTEALDQVASVRLKMAQESRVWLRSPCGCCRLLGMFARLFGVPWLLIEICARSLGYGSVSGVFHGPLLATETTDGAAWRLNEIWAG